jgi:pyruvate kinase
MRTFFRLLLVAALATLTWPSLAAEASPYQSARGAKAKPGIIATLGPKSAKPTTMRSMLRAGMKVARINLTHNNARSAAKLANTLRAAAAKERRKVPLLFDLPGGKVRLGKMGPKPVTLKRGDSYDIVTEPNARTTTRAAAVNFAGLARQARVGDVLLLDDGRLSLRVKSVSKGRIRTQVTRGGSLRSKMGIAIKGKEVSFPSMTRTDRRKLKIAVDNGADWIGVSMTQSPKNLAAVRRALDRLGAKNVKIVAKVESQSALKNLKAIVEHADVIMIARGDLGTAVGPKNLRTAERVIAAEARAQGKTFIAASNYMSNMLKNSSPSSANRADVRTSLKEHPTWFMLNETAIGTNPTKTVRELKKIIDSAR